VLLIFDGLGAHFFYFVGQSLLRRAGFKAGFQQTAESTQLFQLRLAPTHFPASDVWMPRPKKLREEIDSETNQDRTSNSGTSNGAA
jgi:hypothetical protein